MSHLEKPPRSQPGKRARRDKESEEWRDPLVPRPVVSAMALLFLLGMFVCMGLDAFVPDFEGGTYILAFSSGAFLTLGYKVARFKLGGGK